MIMQLAGVPRVSLCNLPTPLHEAAGLSRALGGPRIFLKRDDETGLAIGGNKGRKLEFLIADALEKGADTVISSGSVGSNYIRMSAAAARKCGLESVSVLIGEMPDEIQGNLLLDQVFDSEIHVINEPTNEFMCKNAANPNLVGDIVKSIADEKRKEGKNPYILPGAGFGPLGEAGYMVAASEISDQCYDLGIRPRYAVIAAGSGSTMAGLALGLKVLNTGIRVIGIDMSRLRTIEAFTERIVGTARDTSEYFSLPVTLDADDFELYDYAGEGYPTPSPEAYEAIKLVAETEGVLLDPVYSAKAMAGLIDLVGKGKFNKDDIVLFVHTGGIPALFAESALVENLNPKEIRIINV